MCGFFIHTVHSGIVKIRELYDALVKSHLREWGVNMFVFSQLRQAAMSDFSDSFRKAFIFLSGSFRASVDVVNLIFCPFCSHENDPDLFDADASPTFALKHVYLECPVLLSFLPFFGPGYFKLRDLFRVGDWVSLIREAEIAFDFISSLVRVSPVGRV